MRSPSKETDATLRKNAHVLARQLVAWFAREKRALPWRDERTPYRVWLSEIMLQQTRVAVVEDYFRRFVQRFPSVQSLADASEDEVLSLWSGLGYYSRGRNLHRAARAIVGDHGGIFPSTEEGLRKLPGIGPYTAAAVASFAFGESSAVVDGNVLRVIARMTNDHEPVDALATQARIKGHVLSLVQSHSTGSDVNEGLMELGALICTPKNPNCEACPWSKSCAAREAGTQMELPRKSPRRARKKVSIACVVPFDGERVWLEKRKSSGLFGGLYEPPGRAVKKPVGTDFSDLLAERGLPLVKNMAKPVRVTRTLTHRDLTFFVVAVAVDSVAHPGPWFSKKELGGVGISSAVAAVLDAAWCMPIAHKTDQRKM